MGSQWTVVDPLNGDSGPGQSLQPLVAGLGGAANADFVRIQWPDGIAASTNWIWLRDCIAWRKRDDLPSSCPVLFAWDGRSMRL